MFLSHPHGGFHSRFLRNGVPAPVDLTSRPHLCARGEGCPDVLRGAVGEVNDSLLNVQEKPDEQ